MTLCGPRGVPARPALRPSPVNTMIKSINPSTEETLAVFEPHSREAVEECLEKAAAGFRTWKRTSFLERARVLTRVAARLREGKSEWARIMTEEMGKPIRESEAEIEKCAWNCEFYAQNGEGFLADEPHASNAGESYVEYVPLGTVLAIMPWNFPFWQVLRFAAPALMGGNTALLKHASNVPRCSQALEQIFLQAGSPPGVFQSLLIPADRATELIADPRIVAVTLTGSEAAGSKVAAAAGAAIKKSVLELGGSDPFVVLADADLGKAAATAVRARFQNCGQSCIAAKRFIVERSAYSEFLDRFKAETESLRVGDPLARDTDIGPMARDDLRDDLDRQVSESVGLGAQIVCGGKRLPGRGYFYQPTLLAGATADMPVAREEVFGPVAAVFQVESPEAAVALANDSPYGLGSSLWTGDMDRAKSLARQIEAGQVFVNGMVASDPRLPFGGVKLSGYGRELSKSGIREFVNVQTVWIA